VLCAVQVNAHKVTTVYRNYAILQKIKKIFKDSSLEPKIKNRRFSLSIDKE
jgi:hypothetical protein